MDNVIIVTITAGSRSDASIISPGLLLASVRVNNTYSTQTEVSEVKNFAENADLLAVGGGGGTTRDGWGLRGADVGVVRCGGLFWQWGRLLHHYVGVTGICRRGGINIKNDVQSKSLTNMRDSPPPLHHTNTVRHRYKWRVEAVHVAHYAPHTQSEVMVLSQDVKLLVSLLLIRQSVGADGYRLKMQGYSFMLVTTHLTVCWRGWYSLKIWLLLRMVLPEDVIVVGGSTPWRCDCWRGQYSLKM